MSTANSAARLAPQHPTAINADGTVPRSTVQHLLRSQGQINRLAAEQDLEILGLRAEMERLGAEIDALKARLASFLFWGACIAVVAGIIWMSFGI
ncbi:hypothetical protein ACHAP5_011395 [Fusarium lateritium]